MLTACGSDSQTASPGVGTLSVALSVEQNLHAPDGSSLDIPVPVLPESATTSLTVTDATGTYSHTWESFDTFPQDEDYFAGDYDVRATWSAGMAEGFDSPTFAGSEMVHVAEGDHSICTVNLEMTNSAVSVSFGPDADADNRLLSIDFVSPSGMRHSVEPGEERLLCLVPGRSRLYATLSVAGREESLSLSIGTTAFCTPPPSMPSRHPPKGASSESRGLTSTIASALTTSIISPLPSSPHRRCLSLRFRFPKANPPQAPAPSASQQGRRPSPTSSSPPPRHPFHSIPAIPKTQTCSTSPTGSARRLPILDSIPRSRPRVAPSTSSRFLRS